MTDPLSVRALAWNATSGTPRVAPIGVEPTHDSRGDCGKHPEALSLLEV